jgi:hypothetical protein
MQNLAVLPPIKRNARMALLNVTTFQEISTPDLIAMAQAMPGGTKVDIPDRLTAIVLILGTRPLDTD